MMKISVSVDKGDVSVTVKIPLLSPQQLFSEHLFSLFWQSHRLLALSVVPVPLVLT